MSDAELDVCSEAALRRNLKTHRRTKTRADLSKYFYMISREDLTRARAAAEEPDADPVADIRNDIMRKRLANVQAALRRARMQHRISAARLKQPLQRRLRRSQSRVRSLSHKLHAAKKGGRLGPPLAMIKDKSGRLKKLYHDVVAAITHCIQGTPVGEDEQVSHQDFLRAIAVVLSAKELWSVARIQDEATELARIVTEHTRPTPKQLDQMCDEGNVADLGFKQIRETFGNACCSLYAKNIQRTKKNTIARQLFQFRRCTTDDQHDGWVVDLRRWLVVMDLLYNFSRLKNLVWKFGGDKRKMFHFKDQLMLGMTLASEGTEHSMQAPDHIHCILLSWVTKETTAVYRRVFVDSGLTAAFLHLSEHGYTTITGAHLSFDLCGVFDHDSLNALLQGGVGAATSTHCLQCDATVMEAMDADLHFATFSRTTVDTSLFLPLTRLWYCHAHNVNRRVEAYISQVQRFVWKSKPKALKDMRGVAVKRFMEQLGIHNESGGYNTFKTKKSNANQIKDFKCSMSQAYTILDHAEDLVREMRLDAEQVASWCAAFKTLSDERRVLTSRDVSSFSADQIPVYQRMFQDTFVAMQNAFGQDEMKYKKYPHISKEHCLDQILEALKVSQRLTPGNTSNEGLERKHLAQKLVKTQRDGCVGAKGRSGEKGQVQTDSIRQIFEKEQRHLLTMVDRQAAIFEAQYEDPEELANACLSATGGRSRVPITQDNIVAFVDSVVGQASAGATDPAMNKARHCSRCGKVGHLLPTCPQPPPDKVERPKKRVQGMVKRVHLLEDGGHGAVPLSAEQLELLPAPAQHLLSPEVVRKLPRVWLNRLKPEHLRKLTCEQRAALVRRICFQHCGPTLDQTTKMMKHHVHRGAVGVVTSQGVVL